MTTNETKNSDILGTNSDISDTGSTKITNSDTKNAKSEENLSKINQIGLADPKSQERTIENTAISPKSEENQQKTDDFPSNSQYNTRNLYTESDILAFSKDFPQVDLKKLQSNEHFQSFLSILTKNPTLSQAYACFNAIYSLAEENSQKKLIQALSNAKTSVGSLSSSLNCGEAFFTKEQVQKMSPAQIKVHYDEIRKSQEKW